MGASSLGRWYLIAYPIKIRWRDGDFSSEATLTSTASTGVSPIRRPTSSSTTPTKGSHERSGLGTGAIAGISVGLVLFATAIVALVFFQRRLRAARRKADTTERAPHVDTQHGTPQTVKYSLYELEQNRSQRPPVDPPQELFAMPELQDTTTYSRQAI